MKIKLLVVSVLVLALGINAAEAQNRRGTREHNRYEKQDRQNGNFSGKGKRDNDHGYGNRGNDRGYRSDRMMRNRHRNEFNRHDRSGKRSFFHKRHSRSHSF